jgi:hypothetical protein
MNDFIPDYSRYSIPQLVDVYRRIEKEKYPQKVQIIKNEIITKLNLNDDTDFDNEEIEKLFDRILIEGYPFKTKKIKMEAKEKKYNWIWPKIVDVDSAKKAANQGMYASIFIAGTTLLLLVLSTQGFNPMNLDSYALIDIMIFVIIAWRIYAMSKTAAILGLAFYILEQIFLFNDFGFRMSAIKVIIVIAFINSIRGTYAFNVLKNYSSQNLEKIN